MKPPIEGGIVMITGASSGIGREMALQLADRARAILLVARREARLRQLEVELKEINPKLQVYVFGCDLAQDGEIERLLNSLKVGLGRVDVLINNAGTGDINLFETTSWDKLEQVIRVNVLALTKLTHLLLGQMLIRGRGGILNVSSTLGLIFMPAASVYAGTKHFVTSFTEGLRLELRGTGVVVSQLCPGPVDTEFESVAGNPTGRAVPKALQLTAAECARVGLRGFMKGKALIIPGFLMRLLMTLGRISPRPFLRFFFRGVGRYLRGRAGAGASGGTTQGPGSG